MDAAASAAAEPTAGDPEPADPAPAGQSAVAAPSGAPVAGVLSPRLGTGILERLWSLPGVPAAAFGLDSALRPAGPGRVVVPMVPVALLLGYWLLQRRLPADDRVGLLAGRRPEDERRIRL